MTIHGPFNTDYDSWKFYFGTEVVSLSLSEIQINISLYMGCSYSNAADRYWDGAKWGFPITFYIDGENSNMGINGDTPFYSTSIEYSGECFNMPYYDGTTNTIVEFASKTFTMSIYDDIADTIYKPFYLGIGGYMTPLDGNVVKPTSVNSFGCTLEIPARGSRNLVVNYHYNGADYVTLDGVETNSDTHSETYIYGDYYKYGLDDGNNKEHLYCERNGYSLTGYWNTKADGTGIAIKWDMPFYTQVLCHEYLYIDITTALSDITLDLYLQWKPDKNNIPYIKLNGTFKPGKVFRKMSDGWKEISSVKKY